MFDSHAGMPGGRDSRQRVLHVVRANEIPVNRSTGLAALEHFELREVVYAAGRPRSPQGIRRPDIRASKPLTRRPAPHGERLFEPLVRCVPYDPPPAWDDADQVVKLSLDGLDVRIDVSVVKLEVIE